VSSERPASTNFSADIAVHLTCACDEGCSPPQLLLCTIQHFLYITDARAINRVRCHGGQPAHGPPPPAGSLAANCHSAADQCRLPATFDTFRSRCASWICARRAAAAW
jgi:hypothetical protein